MEFVGKYQHERSENLDGFFKAVGVPYLVRMMINRGNPELTIKIEGDTWTMSTRSLIRTAVKTFKLNEEYVDYMPGKTLKCVTSYDDGKLKTISQTDNGENKTTSIYELDEDSMIMTILHDETKQEAKRYFKKIE